MYTKHFNPCTIEQIPGSLLSANLLILRALISYMVRWVGCGGGIAKTQQKGTKTNMLQPSRFLIVYFLSGERDRARSSHTTPSSPLNSPSKKKTLHGRKRYPCVHRHVKAHDVQDMGNCSAQRYRDIHQGNQRLLNSNIHKRHYNYAENCGAAGRISCPKPSCVAQLDACYI